MVVLDQVPSGYPLWVTRVRAGQVSGGGSILAAVRTAAPDCTCRLGGGTCWLEGGSSARG